MLPKRFEQSRPFFLLGVILLVWLLLPLVVKTATRATFFAIQAPLTVADSYVQDLQTFWSNRLHSKDELLKAGKVHTLVGQKYFGWGSEAVRLLSEIKAGKMPAQKVIDSGVDVVNRANVDAYLTEWNKLERGQ